MRSSHWINRCISQVSPPNLQHVPNPHHDNADPRTRFRLKVITDLAEIPELRIFNFSLAMNHPHHRPYTEWKIPKRQRVIDLHHDTHVTNAEIKPITVVPTSTIRRILKSSPPRHNHNPRSGRPPKLNARDVRRLVRAVTSSQDGKQSSYMQLAKELEIQASESTIRRALRKAGFRRCVACPKPLVSCINRRKRLKWAREHLHWKLND